MPKFKITKFKKIERTDIFRFHGVWCRKISPKEGAECTESGELKLTKIAPIHPFYVYMQDNDFIGVKVEK